MLLSSEEERVDVHRDEWGVPHMWADTVDALARLQGHTAAVDRAWQLSVERWRGEGRLAAHVGAAELGWDRFARRARLDDTARRCYDRLDPDTRRWVDAYVDGVNDAFASGAATAPEFAATGSAPEPWHPWSPLAVFIVQHVLFGTFGNKLWRAHVAATLGPDAVDLFATEGPGGSGSNAWLVAGDPTTGPVIAGDPHRILELPGIYHQVRLTCPEFDVAGLAFPGVPGIAHFGHAGHVAWAVTNAMADYQDLYRERLRRVGDTIEVREATGWVPVVAHREDIRVRGAATESVEVVETPRGPVIDVDRRTGDGLSLRWPARVEGDLGFAALLPLLRARTVDDVAAALTRWVEPVNSVLVADASGAAVRLVAGLVPVRDERCRIGPVPGWEPRYAWRPGYAPRPRTPVVARTVTANDRRPGDTAELGTDFAPPHRAARISALLDAGTDAAAIHLDARLAPGVLLGLLADVDPRTLDAGARALRARLLAWDARMRADSLDAGAYAAWRAALTARLAGHPALAPLHAERPFDSLFAPWTDPLSRIGRALDAVLTGAPRLGVDVTALAADALHDAARRPPVPWGRRHLLQPVHLAVLPAVDAAVDAMNERVTLSGDTDCVLATSSLPGVSDACWRGPVARYVWDLGDRTRSRWIVPFGASGRPDDPHFADQLDRWATGGLIEVFAPPGRPGTRHAMVHTEHLPGYGTLGLTTLRPAEHAALVHGWVTQPRAVYWGMTSYSVDDVREVYEFVDGLATHHAYLVTLDSAPIGLFQTYEPDADPVGERYAVERGDIGMHLLLGLGPDTPRGLTGAVTPALLRSVFADPTRRRVVAEPDVRNERMLRRLRLTGFDLAGEVDMPEKRARLAFLTRERFEALHAAPH